MAGAGIDKSSWRPLGETDPRSLVDARLQLHHAAQIIVSAAISYVSHRDDDSHTNLEWLPELKALATNALPSPSRLRFALRPRHLALLSLVGGRQRSEFSLDGHTGNDALSWMEAELGQDGFSRERLTTKKHYEIPAHPVAGGAPYQGEGEAAPAFRELSHAYHDAWLVTADVQVRTPGASAPRCWPHHFDLATLITLPKSGTGATRTIGCGMSPGDESYAEPYFYVTPSPSPGPEGLAPLPLGTWHTSGWVGAVLPASSLLKDSSPDAQPDRVREYMEAAIGACWSTFYKG